MWSLEFRYNDEKCKYHWNTYLYRMYCLPISNVVTERSAPNADGIGPSKALLPDEMDNDDV